MRNSLGRIHGRLDSAEEKIGEFVWTCQWKLFKLRFKKKPEKMNRTSVPYRTYKINQYMGVRIPEKKEREKNR